jgi:hypothetical protein
MRQSNLRKVAGLPDQLWSQRREAALNWLAIGLLLAAWNAADDGEAVKRRPESLRGYSQVSVRAIARSGNLQRRGDLPR